MKNKEYNFGFDVSGLAEYIDQSGDLIGEMIYAAQTLQIPGIQVIPGKKHDFKLTRTDNDVYLQSDSCGWTTSGSTNFDQVTIPISSLKFQEELCPTDFDDKFLGQQSIGSKPETFPFEQFIVSLKTDKMTSDIDRIAWLGNTTSGSGNLSQADGWLSFISGSTETTYVAAASGTSTASTIMAKVEAMIVAVDERIYTADDLVMFMSVSNYRLLVNAQKKENYVNYNIGIDGKTLETTIDVDGVKIMGLHALRGTNNFVLTTLSNMIFATDLLDETSYIDSWYERKESQVLVEAKFKLGFGFEFDWKVTHNNPNL